MKVTKQNSKPGCPELRKSIDHIKFPAWAEIKYDGEFTYVLHSPTTTCTVNKYGTVREDFPALNQIRDTLNANKVVAGIFLGELYFDGGKLNDIYKLNSNKSSDACELVLFDILQWNPECVTNYSLLDRKELLAMCVGDLAIGGEVVADKAEATAFFEKAKANGYEGVVIKEFDSHLVIGPCSWAKLKGKDQTDYKVLSVDVDKERIEVAVPYVDSSNNPTIVVLGCKAPNRYKKHIKIGDVVTIEHQGVLPSGSLRHPVLIPDPSW